MPKMTRKHEPTVKGRARAASFRFAPSSAFSRFVPTRNGPRSKDEASRARIEIKDLDADRKSFTVDARQGICVSRFDAVIRARTKQTIQETALILFYSGGRELRPEAIIHGGETVYYRVVTGYESVSLGIELQVQDAGNVIEPPLIASLIQDIDKGMTLDGMRSELAQALGVADANRIVISAWGGIRPGRLEGNQWEVRQLFRGWLSRNVIVDVYPDRRYLIVRGLGREYVYHPKSEHESNAVVRYVKSWIHTRIVKGVHQHVASSVTLRTRQIQLKQADEVLEGFSAIEWGSVVDFTLPRDLAEAFSNDEAWLLQTTETCPVCCDSKRPSDIPQQITDACAHSPALCKACLAQWIRSSLDEVTYDRLKCPECPEKLTYQDVRLFGDPRIFDRYDTLATRGALKDIADFRWCLGTNCESGQIHPARCPKFKCHACGSKHCVNHNTPWHKGETCEEYDQRSRRRRKDEKKSEKTIKDTSKKCPECKRDVHKYSGCNHITCICGFEWCYICSARYYETAEGFLRCQHNVGCTERDIFADLGFIPGMARPPPPPPPPPGFPPGPRFWEPGARQQGPLPRHMGVPPVVPAPPLFAEPPQQVREEMENARLRRNVFVDAAAATLAAAAARNRPHGDVEGLTDRLRDFRI